MLRKLLLLSAIALGMADAFAGTIHFNVKGNKDTKWYVRGFLYQDQEQTFLDSVTTDGKSFDYKFSREGLWSASFFPKSESKKGDDGEYYPLHSYSVAVVDLCPQFSFSVNAKFDSKGIEYKVEGNEPNSQIAASNNELNKKYVYPLALLSERFERLSPSDSVRQNALIHAMDSLSNAFQSYTDQYVATHHDTWLAAHTLLYASDSIFKQAYPKLSAELKESVYKSSFDAIKKRIDDEAEAISNEGRLTSGVQAPDFTLPDMYGNKVTLSSLRGKAVILDFWGTWCYWCMKGVPEMKKTYARIAANAEFVGIDCMDKSEDKWRSTVKDNAMYWTQLRNGTDTADVAKLYGIMGYPTKIVIGADGHILKRFVGEDPAFYQYVDSLFTPRLPATYDYQKVMEYVSFDLPQDTDADYTKIILQQIDKKITRHDFRERAKVDFLADFMPQCVSQDPKPYVDLVLKDITADSLRQKLEKCYAQTKKAYGRIWKGEPAPDFTFTDTAGKIHSLKSLRGKYLFIDFWGTWCVPCIEEIPFLQKLQQKYKDNPRLQIMSIACDKNVDKWKTYLNKHREMSWSQYLITPDGNKVIDKTYYVMGIPRFMLIAPDGKIVDSDAPRPSFPTFNAWLEGKLK